MNQGPPPGRALAESRAAIDEIDRQVLDLLGQRMALVTEIAGYKREHGVPIRDRQREREILADRCGRAERLGLPSGEIEALYRLILLTSRDQQAALKAEIPEDLEPRTVAVIGGNGGMGGLMARLFADLGNTVLIVDVDTELSAAEAAARADVVVISVPIQVTEEVIRQVGPHVGPEGLLMDVTSIKQGPVQAMLQSTSAEVLGTHPMFGPNVHSLQGQRVVLCEGRGETWSQWVRRMFHAAGLVIAEVQPEEHDRAMAVVQVLNHFQTEVFGLALSRCGMPLEDTLRFTSPAYRMELYVAARHFAQSAQLYGPIEMTNPERKRITELFAGAVADLADIVVQGKQEEFEAVFRQVGDYFGSFTAEALEQSGFLIDRLVERS